MKYCLLLKCKYCGFREHTERLKPWEMRAKRCAHCGQSDFKVKEIEETGRNAFGYDDSTEPVKDSLNDDYRYD